jgi:hypothetical protein
MSIPINISGTVVNFPSSGESPNYAPAIIQFAQLTAAALAFAIGPFDISPQTFVMGSNVNTNVNLPNLSFPVSQVQGAVITYSVLRTTNSVVVSETGEIFVNYNSSFSVGHKWEISWDFVGGAQITFNITDTGQVQFSTTSIAGTGYQGTITYSAKSVLIT